MVLWNKLFVNKSFQLNFHLIIPEIRLRDLTQQLFLFYWQTILLHAETIRTFKNWDILPLKASYIAENTEEVPVDDVDLIQNTSSINICLRTFENIHSSYLQFHSSVTSSPMSTKGAQYFTSLNSSDSFMLFIAWLRASLASFPVTSSW